MKAFVDPDLCIGCTQCTGICPEVFQMTGILAVAVPGELPPDTVPTAVEAAQACPVSAITISEYPLGQVCVFCKNPPLAPILCYTIN